MDTPRGIEAVIPTYIVGISGKRKKINAVPPYNIIQYTPNFTYGMLRLMCVR